MREKKEDERRKLPSSPSLSLSSGHVSLESKHDDHDIENQSIQVNDSCNLCCGSEISLSLSLFLSYSLSHSSFYPSFPIMSPYPTHSFSSLPFQLSRLASSLSLSLSLSLHLLLLPMSVQSPTSSFFFLHSFFFLLSLSLSISFFSLFLKRFDSFSHSFLVLYVSHSLGSLSSLFLPVKGYDYMYFLPSLLSHQEERERERKKERESCMKYSPLCDVFRAAEQTNRLSHDDDEVRPAEQVF